MEQTNMVMAMYQAVAAQGMVPKTGKNGGKTTDDFQKLLDQKTQGAKSDAPVEQKPKAEAVSGTEEKAPVQEESSLERVKKLAEQGYAITQPAIGAMTLDGQTYQPGEYVIAWKGPDVQFIPVAGLDESQMQQLQQLLTEPVQTIDVSDPEADALLEATDPSVEHKLTDLLEKVVDEQAGQVAEQTVEAVKPQEKDDGQVEIIDADQGAQPLFHDVKAAPVKVGDVEVPQEAEETNVAQQVDAQIAQALQSGETMVRIQLTPENLGQVTVEISQSADGVLRIALNAHNSETRGLLERHAADLQGLVSSRTQQSVEVNVQRGQESQQHQQNYDGHNGHAQDGQDRRRRQQEPADSRDFMQQLRLGLIPTDGEL